MIKDSGQRHEFSSGGVRDMSIGKGKCSLLPLKEVCELTEYEANRFTNNYIGYVSPLRFIHAYIQSAGEHPFGEGDESFIYEALCVFAKKERGWDMPTLVIEVSKHFEEGAIKYKPNNWRLGLDASCYIDSGVRHYLKWKRGDDDENHDRAFVWNMLCMIWTVRNKPEFNDIAKMEETPNADRPNKQQMCQIQDDDRSYSVEI